MSIAQEVEQAVARAVSPLNAKLARMEKLWTEMLVRKPSQKQLAKRMGVARSTLWRRRQKADAQARLNGTL